MKATDFFLAGVASLTAVLSAARAVEPISPDQFAAIGSLIKPRPDEDRWGNIPWLTDLWQARQIAAEQGKPILLWEMDGHPLGCT